MSFWRYGLGVSVAIGLGWALVNGCSAGGSGNTGLATSGTGAAPTTGSGAAGPGGSTGVGFTTGTTTTGTMMSTGTTFPVSSSATGTGGAGGGGLGALGACANSKSVAQQAPAAMLIVLQRSASMSAQGKWPASQQAITQAISESVFDTMSLGLLAFPNGFVGAPDCICPGFGPTCGGLLPQGVTCGFPTQPQVPIQPAAGARTAISQWLMNGVNAPPAGDQTNGTPMYDALNGAYQAIQAFTGVDKRMVMMISDGGGSCTSLSSPSRPGISDGMCPDWEYPTTMRTLIANAQTAAVNPVDTFIVGVPGSNSNGGMSGLWANAPYSMLLALSTYAAAGSPTTLPANCDSSAVWTQGGSPPAAPCHIDFSNPANFNANALATAIATLRGQLLGCVYPVPMPSMGMVDPNQVNVVVTINGTPYIIPKRTNPSDTCLTGNNPCWDYTDGTDKNIELVGITCSTVSTTPSAEVDIYVGCDTIFQ